eukprot:TRINITY_DN22880_c0_g1_i1.p1 TRINITY_DN22880_c0_g1~~TRINITY_DN22880_c0_g1_i1.p1  ORF type:complete len:875 (+),score=114.22 TRINITY_DN22880_c0_g1_i1:83-2626(+)
MAAATAGLARFTEDFLSRLWQPGYSRGSTSGTTSASSIFANSKNIRDARCLGSASALHIGVFAAAAAASIPMARAISSADCWVGGWTPEICCSAPGAKGNPLCWDQIYTYDKCCTETEEGIKFDLRRRSFVSDLVRRGATVHFDIRHVSGGRTGAVASRAMSPRATVLRVPAEQVYSLKSVQPVVNAATRKHGCDAHAVLALGLALEKLNPASMLSDWIRLLPLTFANVLWFTERQLKLVNSTFFAYIVDNWFGDLDCMRRAADDIAPQVWRGRRVDFEDLRWALSVVKTRGFAFEGTRESTMLIPLADFLNHNMVASVRTSTLAEDALRFVATKNIMPGEELCIDYAQASNLEFLVRYGFRVEDNPYGGRQFDLGGEPMQAHCPLYILRYDTENIIDNSTVDCHRQARYLSFEQQFGKMQLHEQLREDRYIYQAVEEACQQLLSMLDPPQVLAGYEGGSSGSDGAVAEGITQVLIREIRTERVLLSRCVQEFRTRQTEVEPRPVPAALAEPLARLRGSTSGEDDEAHQGSHMHVAGASDFWPSPQQRQHHQQGQQYHQRQWPQQEHHVPSQLGDADIGGFFGGVSGNFGAEGLRNHGVPTALTHSHGLGGLSEGRQTIGSMGIGADGNLFGGGFLGVISDGRSEFGSANAFGTNVASDGFGHNNYGGSAGNSLPVSDLTSDIGVAGGIGVGLGTGPSGGSVNVNVGGGVNGINTGRSSREIHGGGVHGGLSELGAGLQGTTESVFKSTGGDAIEESQSSGIGSRLRESYAFFGASPGAFGVQVPENNEDQSRVAQQTANPAGLSNSMGVGDGHGSVGGGGAPFSLSVDRSQVDQLLRRLQQGASLV